MKKELKFNNVMDVLECYVESAENEFCKFLTFMGGVEAFNGNIVNVKKYVFDVGINMTIEDFCESIKNLIFCNAEFIDVNETTLKVTFTDNHYIYSKYLKIFEDVDFGDLEDEQ